MNVKTTIATLSILSALSFGAVAAESVTAVQALELQPAGSVSGVAGSPMEINQKLSDKAISRAASSKTIRMTLPRHR